LAISYDRCVRDCTPEPESFSFSEFSRKFTTWLVPWIALISQLPFGTHDGVDNLMSAVYTVASPTLAGYSLTLTVLNGRWLNNRIKHIRGGIKDNQGNRYTSTVKIVLERLQQTALQINTDQQQLALLVTSQNGHLWWRKMEKSLDYSKTWTISAVTTLGWVFVTYVLTVADALNGLWRYNDTFGLGPGTYPDSHSDGQAVGGIWLWLLPIVIGWLLVSPKCDCDANSRALEEADLELQRVDKESQYADEKLQQVNLRTPENPHTHDGGETQLPNAVAQDEADRESQPVNSIELSRGTGAFHIDENCSAPIFNYARFIPWTQAVETVLAAYYSASCNKRKGRVIEDMPDQLPDRWGEGGDAEGGIPLYPLSKRGQSIATYSLW
jgi:hypothetical protein